MFQNSKVVQQYVMLSARVFALLSVCFIELAELTEHIIVSRVNHIRVKSSESIQSYSPGKKTDFLFDSRTLSYGIGFRMLLAR